MGAQFSDKDRNRNDAVALVLRNLNARVPDEVAELAQQARNETLGVEFHDSFCTQFRI